MIAKLAGVVLKAFFDAFGSALSDMFRAWRLEEAAAARGRAESERDQAREGERVQGELADQAAKRVDIDDAISLLERGEA